MPDQNDIVFNQYSLDFFAFIDFFYVHVSNLLFGTGAGTGPGGLGGGQGLTGALSAWTPSAIFDILTSVWGFLVVLSWVVTSVIFFGLVYAYIRHDQLGEVGTEILRQQEAAFAKLHKKDVKNARWQDVLTHIDSDRPNDWKLAIIEADVILEELLNSLGYAGTSVGEKLKSASPESFKTLDQAWRAHNTRNRVAHEGGDFDLSERAAKETITEYQMVFEEFDFV